MAPERATMDATSSMGARCSSTCTCPEAASKMEDGDGLLFYHYHYHYHYCYYYYYYYHYYYYYYFIIVYRDFLSLIATKNDNKIILWQQNKNSI